MGLTKISKKPIPVLISVPPCILIIFSYAEKFKSRNPITTAVIIIKSTSIT